MTRLMIIPALLISSFFGFASEAHAGSNSLTVTAETVLDSKLRGARRSAERAVKRASAARGSARERHVTTARELVRRYKALREKARSLPDTTIVFHGSELGFDLDDAYRLLQADHSKFGKTWHIYDWNGKGQMDESSPKARQAAEKRKQQKAAKAKAKKKAGKSSSTSGGGAGGGGGGVGGGGPLFGIPPTKPKTSKSKGGK